jgi:hypothetical protein
MRDAHVCAKKIAPPLMRGLKSGRMQEQNMAIHYVKKQVGLLWSFDGSGCMNRVERGLPDYAFLKEFLVPLVFDFK